MADLDFVFIKDKAGNVLPSPYPTGGARSAGLVVRGQTRKAKGKPGKKGFVNAQWGDKIADDAVDVARKTHDGAAEVVFGTEEEYLAWLDEAFPTS